MAATHNLVVADEYESNGETKTKWTTIGVLIETEKDGKKRKSIKLNFIPTNWDGFASVFAIDRDKNGRQDNRRDASPEEHAQASDDMNQGNHTNDTLNDLGGEAVDLEAIPF